MLVGTVGLAIFWYGRKQKRIPHLVAGLLMLVFPFLVSNVFAVLGIGAALGVGLWLAVRFGL